VFDFKQLRSCVDRTMCSGGLEPAFRVLLSAIFHGVSLGNFHQGTNLWKGVESKL
jgi:hypothetical protein